MLTATATPPAAPPAGDDLDNLLDENITLDDIFRDVDTDMRASKEMSFPVRSTGSNQVDSLGIDEAVKIEKKRAPVAKLDEARLLSQAGIPKLRRITKQRLKFKGKGHEYSDVARLLQHYQLWLDELYPRAKFADGLMMIEKLGHSKRMQTMRKEWIDEGKPRRRDEEEAAPEQTLGIDQQHRGEDATLMSGALDSGRPKTPPAHDPDDDLYSATPQAVEKQRRKDGEAQAGDGLFMSDDEDAVGQPDGDELDALLAEDSFQPPAATAPMYKPPAAQTRREDDFDDEMEAMEGMDDMW